MKPLFAKTWVAGVCLGAALLAGFAAGRRSQDRPRSPVEAVLSGAAYGACIALERARSEKLLTPEETSRLYQEFMDREEQAVQATDPHFRFQRAQRSCPQVLDGRRAAISATRP